MGKVIEFKEETDRPRLCDKLGRKLEVGDILFDMEDRIFYIFIGADGVFNLGMMANKSLINLNLENLEQHLNELYFVASPKDMYYDVFMGWFNIANDEAYELVNIRKYLDEQQAKHQMYHVSIDKDQLYILFKMDLSLYQEEYLSSRIEFCNKLKKLIEDFAISLIEDKKNK